MPLVFGRFELLERSCSFDQVKTLGGFKTHPSGHVDFWRESLRKRPELRGFAYEYFPRGRVNWREADNSFLFLGDALVFEEGFHKELCDRWGLVSEAVIFLCDPHYKSPTFTREWRRGTYTL